MTFLPPPPSDLLAEPDLSTWSILLAYRGSIAHGMHNPDPESIDDVDLMGVVVPPREYYLGLSQYGSRGTKEIKRDRWDVVIYEARKMIGLLQKGNPNVLSLLFTKREHFLGMTAAGQHLRDNRDLFLSKEMGMPFIGYAEGQLAKMTRGATDQAYMGAKRKALKEQFGYDTKNAAHCLRLLYMAREAFDYGEIVVDRTGRDAQFLLAVKGGGFSLAEIQGEYRMAMNGVRIAFRNTKLPDLPDYKAIGQLCVEVVEMAWEERE
jgi:uncharacterized protein